MHVTLLDPTAPLLDLPPQPVGPPAPVEPPVTDELTTDRKAA
jgi:hypothetical protein